MEREELWVGVEAACPCFSEEYTDPIEEMFTRWTRSMHVYAENVQSRAQEGVADG